MAEIKIKRDEEGILALSIESEDPSGECVGWELSDELKVQLAEELKGHLGGELSEQFDPVIKEALQMVE